LGSRELMMGVMKMKIMEMMMTQEWKNFSMILSQTTTSLLKVGGRTHQSQGRTREVYKVLVACILIAGKLLHGLACFRKKMSTLTWNQVR
jgi:hypothetical protein